MRFLYYFIIRRKARTWKSRWRGEKKQQLSQKTNTNESTFCCALCLPLLEATAVPPLLPQDRLHFPQRAREGLPKAVWLTATSQGGRQGSQRRFHSRVSLRMGVPNIDYWVVLVRYINPYFPPYLCMEQGFLCHGVEIMRSVPITAWKASGFIFPCTTTVYQCNIFHLNP